MTGTSRAGIAEIIPETKKRFMNQGGGDNERRDDLELAFAGSWTERWALAPNPQAVCHSAKNCGMKINSIQNGFIAGELVIPRA